MAEKFPVKVVVSAVDKATGPLSSIQRKLERFNAPLKHVGASMAGVGNAAGDLAAKIATLGGVAAAGFGVIIKDAADTGDAIAKQSKRAGLAADQFQRLAYAASFADVEQDKLVQTMGKLNANIVDGRKGMKILTEAFSFAGVGADDLRKLKPEQILGRIADKIKDLAQDDPRRGALARALLGKSGSDIIPFLEAGSAAIAKMGDEAAALGLVIPQEMLDQAEEFNDTFSLAQKVVVGISRALGAQLIPLLTPLIKRFIEFVKVNQDLIKQKLSWWVDRIGAALDAIDWEKTIANVEKFFSNIDKAVGFVGGFGNALLILVAIMAGPLLVALGSLVTSVYALGAAIFAIPGIGWALALAAGMVVLYNKSEIFRNAIDGVWDAMQKIAGFILPDWLKRVFSGNGASVNVNSKTTTSAPVNSARQAVAAGQTGRAVVDVNFTNMPRGTDIKPAKNSGVNLNLGMGYAMGGS